MTGFFIGFVALKFGGIPSWPTPLQLSKGTQKALSTPWKYVRSIPTDGMPLENEKCISCGWWTNSCHRNGYFEGNNKSMCNVCRHPGAAAYRYYCQTVLALAACTMDALYGFGKWFVHPMRIVYVRVAGACFKTGTKRVVFAAWRAVSVRTAQCRERNPKSKTGSSGSVPMICFETAVAAQDSASET